MRLIARIGFTLMCMPGGASAMAAVPLSAESWQLQQLVKNSEKQIETTRELLSNAKQDTQSLDQAEKILEQLSSGLGKSIKGFQGTKIYEKALLELQKDDDFLRGAADPQAESEASVQKRSADFLKFQQDSVRANSTELGAQEKLEQALQTAEPGFIPRLQTQAQLGGWQANTRLSSQLTQLLSAVHELREDLHSGGNGGLSSLVNGSNMLNQQQRESTGHGAP